MLSGVDFPDPDSPTIPSRWPRATVKPTPSSARTGARRRKAVPGSVELRDVGDLDERRCIPSARRRAVARRVRKALLCRRGGRRLPGRRPRWVFARPRVVECRAQGEEVPVGVGGVEIGGGEQAPGVGVLCGSVKISSTVPVSTMRPWYMTMTRSHSPATTARSWVMKSAPPDGVDPFGDEVEHLLLHRDVEGGRRFVADERPRGVGEGDREHDPAPLPSGELVRVGQAGALGSGHPHVAEEFEHPSGDLRAGTPPWRRAPRRSGRRPA